MSKALAEERSQVEHLKPRYINIDNRGGQAGMGHTGKRDRGPRSVQPKAISSKWHQESRRWEGCRTPSRIVDIKCISCSSIK